jgi:AmmeMemoRadiSam system protein B
MTRFPAVAGRFYSADPVALASEIKGYLHDCPEKTDAMAIISPHAGFIYSGHVAGAVYSCVEIPDRVIILGPNHTGIGAMGAVMAKGEWAMPMGMTPVDAEVASAIVERSVPLIPDTSAHMHEHSLEVQLPFLQYINPDIKIVPICLGPFSLEECVEIGNTIADVVEEQNDRTLLVASSDMSHYEPQAQAERMDGMALEKIRKMDPAGLWHTVKSAHISMCGIIPVTVAMFAAIRLGATRADIVKYATSGDISGDYSSVVGYAGCIIS